MTNNSSSTATSLPGLADLKFSTSSSLLPFTGFAVGDTLVYHILYKNDGGRTVSGVSITSSLASVVTASPTSRNFPTLAPGQTGELWITGNLNTFLTSGQTFVSSFSITGNAVDINMTNNSLTITGIIAGHP